MSEEEEAGGVGAEAMRSSTEEEIGEGEKDNGFLLLKRRKQRELERVMGHTNTQAREREEKQWASCSIEGGIGCIG